VRTHRAAIDAPSEVFRALSSRTGQPPPSMNAVAHKGAAAGAEVAARRRAGAAERLEGTAARRSVHVLAYPRLAAAAVAVGVRARATHPARSADLVRALPFLTPPSGRLRGGGLFRRPWGLPAGQGGGASGAHHMYFGHHGQTPVVNCRTNGAAEPSSRGGESW